MVAERVCASFGQPQLLKEGFGLTGGVLSCQDNKLCFLAHSTRFLLGRRKITVQQAMEYCRIAIFEVFGIADLFDLFAPLLRSCQ